MLIALEPPAEEFTIGARLQVNILEPASNAAHTIDVVVRYCQPGALGVEFVSGP
jgi:hypothetical protein